MTPNAYERLATRAMPSHFPSHGDIIHIPENGCYYFDSHKF